MTRTFASDTSEIAAARRVVRDQLAEWGMEADQMALELVVSELVTNAIVHGRGRIELRLTLGAGRLRLDVTDEGTGAPTAGTAVDGAEDMGGWGLRFVDTMSDSWGLACEDDGTHVWMERGAEGEGPWPRH